MSSSISSPRIQSHWTSIPAIAREGELRIHSRVGGFNGSRLPPLVLVPGFGVGSSYLLPLAGWLANHGRVLAPDLPGHGRSDHDHRPLTIPEHAAALVKWMGVVGLESTVVVGHSLGCQIAAEIAGRDRERIAGVVLIGPTSYPAARSTVRQLGRGAVSSVFDRPTYMLRAARDYWRAGPKVLRAEMREMITHRIEDVLPTLDLPARVVRGGRDRLVPQKWAERVAHLLGAPPPTAVRGWGHVVHYDDPEAVGRVVLELARTLTR